jgi:hypothetical protein
VEKQAELESGWKLDAKRNLVWKHERAAPTSYVPDIVHKPTDAT